MNGSVQHSEYDLEPVKFCSRCYSLKIEYENDLDSECCAECGSTDIQEASIEEWEQKYERRYGYKLTQKTQDPSKTYFFKLTTRDLMDKVANSPKWWEIIRGVYPHFPRGYGRTDSVVLFFDTLIKQNKLGELRLYLFKHFNY